MSEQGDQKGHGEVLESAHPELVNLGNDAEEKVRVESSGKSVILTKF